MDPDSRGVETGITMPLRRAPYALLGLALMAALGTLGCRSSSQTSSSNNAPASAVKAVLHLESFVVNLADPEGNRYLRVGIEIGLGSPLGAKMGKDGEGEIPVARIRDCILTVLSTWRSDALLAPEGKEKLKAELVTALRRRVPGLDVSEIYFTDFLVQR